MIRVLVLALALAVTSTADRAYAATVGPIAELPAVQGMGREAFPVDPIGRTWSYVRLDGTRVRREIRKWDYECIDHMLDGIDCYERALATVAIGTDGAVGRERVLTVDGCGDRWVRHALDWRDPGAEWTPRDLPPRVWFPLEFPLHTGLSWDDTSNDVDLLKRKEETGPVKPDTRYRVLGKAFVEVIAGRFPVTAVVESTPIQPGAPPARRVFYAANVGPVLEQTQNATGTWITDLELESYEAKPATVMVHSDKQLAGRDQNLAAAPSPASSAIPSAAEIGPLEPLPAGLAVGTQILLPFEHLGRSWLYRDAKRGTLVERVVLPPDTIQRIVPHPVIRSNRDRSPCKELEVGTGDPATHAFDLDAGRYFLCTDGVLWQPIVRCGATPREIPAIPPTIAQSSSWLDGADDLGSSLRVLHGRLTRTILGRARVITPAGSFENAVLIETSEPAHGDKPARAVRRTYYAANVGPVLVLVPEADGRWVADLVLESIVVPPPAAPPKSQP